MPMNPDDLKLPNFLTVGERVGANASAMIDDAVNAVLLTNVRLTTTTNAANAPALSRVEMMVDPLVLEALRQHLTTRYAGTGVGYSEFIRRALLWDLADVEVPERVQPDTRWDGKLYAGEVFAGEPLRDGPNGRAESTGRDHENMCSGSDNQFMPRTPAVGCPCWCHDQHVHDYNSGPGADQCTCGQFVQP